MTEFIPCRFLLSMSALLLTCVFTVCGKVSNYMWKRERKQLEKKGLFYFFFKFADPINKVYLQPKSSNNTLFYTDRC